MNFRTPYGLPVRWREEDGKHIENEFLFGVYEMVFCRVKNESVYKYYKYAYRMEFPNHIHPDVPEKEISHDQLTAYSCYSFMISAEGHADIFNSIKKFKIKGRLLHPRDYLYYALLNYKLVGYLGLPLIYLFCLSSMLIGYRLKDGKITPKLSGELLWILRYKAVENSTVLRTLMFPCKMLVKLGAYLRFGGTRGMIKKYFNNYEGHPIVEGVKCV